MIRSTPALGGQLSDIDIRLLRVFKGVVEHGGYSKAEVALNISRSTISIHMSDLETRLGITLCNRGRGRSGFSLTDEGRQVYNAINELFGQMDQFRHRVNAIQSQLTGELRIALPDDILEISQLDLVTAIRQFREQAPNVGIEVVAHAPNEVDLDILNGHADVGINVVLTRHPALEYLPLFAHRMSLYCGQPHPLFDIADDALNLERIIQYELVGSSSRYGPEILQRYDLFTRRASANHMSGRCLLVLSGTYLGFLPDYYAATWVERGLLRKIELPELNYNIDNAVIFRRDGVKKVLVDLFVKAVARLMPIQ